METWHTIAVVGMIAFPLFMAVISLKSDPASKGAEKGGVMKDRPWDDEDRTTPGELFVIVLWLLFTPSGWRLIFDLLCSNRRG